MATEEIELEIVKGVTSTYDWNGKILIVSTASPGAYMESCFDHQVGVLASIAANSKLFLDVVREIRHPFIIVGQTFVQ
jgi:hypothetical protein